jgi:hypothetical protein
MYQEEMKEFAEFLKRNILKVKNIIKTKKR